MCKSVLFFFLFIFSFCTLSLQAEVELDLISKKNIDIPLDQKKIRVIYFLSSQCPCSQSHFDHLNQLKNQYSQFTFVGFHSNKKVSQENAIKYFSRFKIDFPVFSDNEIKYANKYGALKTPHVFVLDQNDKLVFQGGATNSHDINRATKFYLKDTLEALSNGKEPPLKEA
ncbi:MAG: thioredoxin-like domain-containing protein, partial [Bacteriovoracaceae bacterium]